jgi:cation-transporting ATPase 13A1
MIQENPLILDNSEEWISVDEMIRFPYEKPLLVHSIRKQYHLCVTGHGMDFLIRQGILEDYLHHIRVFARVSPEQKDWILNTLKRRGFMTLMCGDGTNDVGALKQAHIGKFFFTINVLYSIIPFINNRSCYVTGKTRGSY